MPGSDGNQKRYLNGTYTTSIHPLTHTECTQDMKLTNNTKCTSFCVRTGIVKQPSIEIGVDNDGLMIVNDYYDDDDIPNIIGH